MNNKRRMQANDNRSKGKKDGYTPFQKVVLVFSVLLIIATITVSALYITGRGKPKVKPSDRSDTGKPEETQTQEETGEENWDGISLKKTADAGQKYVDNTLFIGDSNFRRLTTFRVVDSKKVIGMPDKGIQNALYDRETYLSGYTDGVSVATAIARIEPRRVLLNFGTNNLTGDADNFVSVYRDFINEIKSSYSETDIIVMSVPPVSYDVNTGYGTITMEDVDAFNAALKEMCGEMGIPFLNVTDDLLKDPETGYAKEGYIYSDGIHLEEKALRDLVEYYRCHAYLTDDRRSTKGFNTYTIDAPERKESLDCDRLLSDVTVRLVSAGYTMAMSGDDKTTIENSYSYTVPSDADKDSLDQYSKEVYDFISSRCSKDSKLKISWYDTSSGSHVFTITEYMICAEHKFGDWEIVEASTCVKEGKRKHKCTICDFEEEVSYPIDPTNHTYDWEVITDATCTEEGEKKGTCSGCGTVLYDYIEAKGHDWVTTIEGYDATCTEDGRTSQIECSVCGEVQQYSETIPAYGHDYYETTDEEGNTIHVCSRCGDTY